MLLTCSRCLERVDAQTLADAPGTPRCPSCSGILRGASPRSPRAHVLAPATEKHLRLVDRLLAPGG